MDAFQARQRFKRAAPKTISTYAPTYRALIAWAGDRQPGALTALDLEAFCASVEDDFVARRGRAPGDAWRKTVVTALKSLYKYLHTYGLLVDDARAPVTANPAAPLDMPTVTTKPYDWLREHEDEALLTTAMDEREAAIVWFLRWTGLRISEATSLRIADVDFVAGLIHVRQSKTARGIRTVPITPELRPRLARFTCGLQDHLVCAARTVRAAHGVGHADHADDRG